MAIVEKLQGDVYINPIGGVDLYDKDVFKEHGITLAFHRMDEIKYTQFDKEFVPSLSILDVLMFQSKEEIKQLLNRYSLL